MDASLLDGMLGNRERAAVAVLRAHPQRRAALRRDARKTLRAREVIDRDAVERDASPFLRQRLPAVRVLAPRQFALQTALDRLPVGRHRGKLGRLRRHVQSVEERRLVVAVDYRQDHVPGRLLLADLRSQAGVGAVGTVVGLLDGDRFGVRGACRIVVGRPDRAQGIPIFRVVRLVGIAALFYVGAGLRVGALLLGVGCSHVVQFWFDARHDLFGRRCRASGRRDLG